MNPKLQQFKDQFAKSIPDFYYHSDHMTFLFQQTTSSARQDWIEVNEGTAITVLAAAGVRAERNKGETLSPAAEMLLNTRLNSEKSVKYAGPLAGHMKGVVNFGPFNALITESPKIPRPVKGDFSLIKYILDEQFGDLGGVQLPYLYSALKLAYEMLVAGDLRGGPALIFCGPRNSGKTFVQEQVITPLLGGRMAPADRYLNRETSFNMDLMKAEHLVVSDGVMSTSINSRRDLGNSIKNMVANGVQSAHGKGKDAISVNVYTRLTMSLNDEIENIMGLPPMDESMRDKLMLFKTRLIDWPVFAVTPEEKRAFKESVLAQIPAFCWWLVNEFVIPSDLQIDPKTNQPARFGVNCYHHPDILRQLVEVSPEYRFLELLRTCFVLDPNGISKHDELRMSALEIEQGLTSSDSPVEREARRLLSTGTRARAYLERLSHTFPDSVTPVRTSTKRLWVIRDVDAMLASVVS